MEVMEGKARIDTGGVFYNPRMKFCRDMDILLARSVEKPLEFLDSLSATGVRGIRMALEAGMDVTLNDRGKNAYRAILRNCEINGIDCRVMNMDANLVYHTYRFDWVDVDPFGSPVEFLDGAVRCARKFISITATDTAPLSGTYPKACLRKYDALSYRTDFYPEVGLRILAGKLARVSAGREKGIRLMLSWGREHYFRVHAGLRRGGGSADRAMEKVGYVFYCKKCGWRTARGVYDDFPERCNCGEKLFRIGPLWMGELEDRETVRKMLKDEWIDDMREHRSLLSTILDELDIPFHYDLHYLGKVLKRNVPSTSMVVDALSDLGYMVSTTRFSGTSIKTDAPLDVIKKLFFEGR